MDYRDMMPDSEEYYMDHYKYEYVLKECKRCGQTTDMRTDHGICDSCANAMEQGWEYWAASGANFVF